MQSWRKCRCLWSQTGNKTVRFQTPPRKHHYDIFERVEETDEAKTSQKTARNPVSEKETLSIFLLRTRYYVND